MPGNPNLRAASVHPFHRSMAITDPPRAEGWNASEQQVVQTDGGGQASGLRRDQLLAEIEELAGTLKEKVARYSSSRAVELSEHAAEQANRTALVWIHDALEDIAATALGIEIASRKLFLQAASAGFRDSTSETDQEPSAGTAE